MISKVEFSNFVNISQNSSFFLIMMTLWVKELLNVAHTLFIFFGVSQIYMVCFKSKTSAIGSILENLVHRKLKFGNAKISSVFYVICLLISRLLGLGN